MIRYLSVTEGKNLQIRKAAEAMTRGAAVTVDYTDGTLDLATAENGFFLVDVAPNYNGANAYITPTDGSFETIADDALVITVPTLVGERYAVSELTKGTLAVGDPIKAASGKFVAAEATDVVEWVYGGEYTEEPSDITMYIVERVAQYTVA